MAKETVTVVTCDVCGSEDGAQEYMIVRPSDIQGRCTVLDLCRKHAAPLHDLAKLGRDGRVSARSASTGRRRRKPIFSAPILTQEEIDAIEAKESKKA